MSTPDDTNNYMEKDEYLANKFSENRWHRWQHREVKSLTVRIDPSIIKAPLTKEELKAKLDNERIGR